MNNLQLSHESLSRLLSKTYEMCEYVISNTHHLPLGSHTAEELHKYCSERAGKKYVSRYWTYAGMSSNDGFYTKDIDPYSMLTIHNGVQEISIPAGTIFDFTRMLEEQSGLSGKKAHLFTVENPGELVASQSVRFPTQKEMTRFASSMGKRFPQGADSFSFSLVDGSIVCQIRYYGEVHLDCIEFIQGELPDVSFKLKVDQLKKIHDTCKLELYQDRTSMQYSIMITNPEGVVVASDRMATKTGVYNSAKNRSAEPNVNRHPASKSAISNAGDTTVERANQPESIPPANEAGGSHANDTPLLHPELPQGSSPAKRQMCREYGKRSIPGQKSKKRFRARSKAVIKSKRKRCRPDIEHSVKKLQNCIKT